MLSRALSLLILISLTLGCSTYSNSKKRLGLVGAGFGAGALIGVATAPKDERSDQHAVYWGAILGLTGAVIGNYLYSDEQDSALLQQENAKLKAELSLIQEGNKILIDQGKGKFKNPIGETTLQGKKATWKVYQLDRWQAEGPNRLYHQDQMIEVTPQEK